MARPRWKLIVPTAALAVAPFTVCTPQAQAFFPPVSGPPLTVSPVVPPPFIVVPPVVPPPVIVVPPTTPPNAVPEPSTLLGGLAGLSAAAGWAARRRRK